VIIQQAFVQVLALIWYGCCLVQDNMEACRAVSSPVRPSHEYSLWTTLLAELQIALLGVLCPRSLILGSPFGAGYVSSTRLPYMALLSLNIIIINTGLPRVALLFLILMKCSAAVPNYSTTFARSSWILQNEGCVFIAILSHQVCLELASNVKVSSHCLCVWFGSNWRFSVRSSCQGNKYGKYRT
jgi:hypothetical protein